MERRRRLTSLFFKSVVSAALCVIGTLTFTGTIDAQAVSAKAEFKNWSDNSGSFSVEAKLLKINATSVTLRKSNRVIIDVPFSRLSKRDLSFVKSQLAKSNPNYVSPRFVNRQNVLRQSAEPKPTKIEPFPTSLDLQNVENQINSDPHAPPLKDYSNPIRPKPAIQLAQSIPQNEAKTFNPNFAVPKKDTLTTPKPTNNRIADSSSLRTERPQAMNEPAQAAQSRPIIRLKSPANTLRQSQGSIADDSLRSDFDKPIVRKTFGPVASAKPNTASSTAFTLPNSNPNFPTQTEVSQTQFQPPTKPPTVASSDTETQFQPPTKSSTLPNSKVAKQEFQRPEPSSFTPPTAINSATQANHLPATDSSDFVMTTSTKETQPPKFKFNPPPIAASNSATSNSNNGFQPNPSTPELAAPKTDTKSQFKSDFVFTEPPSFGPRTSEFVAETNLKLAQPMVTLDRLPIELKTLAKKLIESREQTVVFQTLTSINQNWPTYNHPALISLTQQCVESNNTATRKLAYKMLAIHDTEDSGTYIVKAIQDESPEIRRATYLMINDFDATQLIPALADRLASEDRKLVASVLENLGDKAEDNVIPFMAHQSPDVQLTACSLLGKIGTAKSIAKLETLVSNSDNPRIRMQANNSIKQIRTRTNAPRG